MERFVLLMMYRFTSAGGDRLMQHKYKLYVVECQGTGFTIFIYLFFTNFYYGIILLQVLRFEWGLGALRFAPQARADEWKR